MKRLIIPSMVLASLLASSGCQTAHIKTADWEATINSHWFKRDVDSLTVRRTADGGYDIALNGYRGDASEQLPQFTRETLAGLVAIGQLIPMASKTAAPTYAATTAARLAPAASTAPCADGSCADPDACSDGSCADPDACSDGSCADPTP